MPARHAIGPRAPRHGLILPIEPRGLPTTSVHRRRGRPRTQWRSACRRSRSCAPSASSRQNAVPQHVRDFERRCAAGRGRGDREHARSRRPESTRPGSCESASPSCEIPTGQAVRVRAPHPWSGAAALRGERRAADSRRTGRSVRPGSSSILPPGERHPRRSPPAATSECALRRSANQ